MTGDASDVEENRHPPAFNETTVEFSANRLDVWVQRLGKLLGPLAELPPVSATFPAQGLCDLGVRQDTATPIHDVVKALVWEVRRAMLANETSTPARLRIVQLAAVAVQTPEAALMELESVVPSADPSQVLRCLRLISRISSNLRMLACIANLLPSFRTVIFIKVETPASVRLARSQVANLAKAWKRLGLADGQAIPPSLLNKGALFRKGCSRAFPVHCEVQLLLRYENDPSLVPSLAYFGCSKKACFLCFHFLSLSSLRPRVRGHHGVCHPLWGVGPTHSEELRKRLQELCEIVKQRIAQHVVSPSREAPMVVTQSTIVSDVNTGDMVELRRQVASRKLLESESERARQRRQIL